jgi:hypothetical protein
MRLGYLTLCIALLLAFSTATPAGCDTTCGLSDYNRDMLLAYIVDNDTGPLEQAATDAFFVVTPGGIESREHVIATVGNLDVTAAEVFTHRIEVLGDTAVLAGKITLDGNLNGRPAPDLGFLSVFRMIDNEWYLVARSLVPQLGPPAGARSAAD